MYIYIHQIIEKAANSLYIWEEINELEGLYKFYYFKFPMEFHCEYSDKTVKALGFSISLKAHGHQWFFRGIFQVILT